MKAKVFFLLFLGMCSLHWGFLSRVSLYKLSPKLQYLVTELEQPRNRNNQIFLLDFIIQSTDPLKNEVLKDVVMFDIRGADIYGNSRLFSVETRIHALTNIHYTTNDGYMIWYILKFDKSYEVRKWAARMARHIKEDNFIKGISYLLNYDYYIEKFQYQDPKMQKIDEIVLEIVKSLGESGSPKAVPILLQIVHIQNHLPQTIEAAWLSLEKIPFPNPAYPYFILSLKDSLKNKPEQVPSSQKDQVDKVVQTLTEFITNNFERNVFSQEDLDIAKGERKDAEQKSRTYPGK
ncbi:MAG: HEAT repeat domain-containing protein [Brevinematales bacterium]|nr:HEAT repeat domain-containing protein [Brevinematales bacterium]